MKSNFENIHTDVLIIGGGIAGILTAYFLDKNGVDYILVEKDKICSGITGRTTAKITAQHGLIYQKLVKSMGVENAGKYLDINLRACSIYEKMCADIDCDYEVKNNYVYSVNNSEKLIKEMEALRKIKYKAKLCDEITLPFKTAGAVMFSSQAQFNPVKFLTAISENLNIREDTFVKEMIGNTAVTGKGIIQADKVVVTTHFPFINKHGSYFLKLYQHRSYVVALKGAREVDGMYVDEDKRGLSFRNYGNYLLMGGGGRRTGQCKGGPDKLKSYAGRLFPNSEICAEWAAQDCMSLDGVPYIGRYSKSTHDLYVATGFNKWGMTSSMVSAMLLTDMIMGRKNEYAGVFNPSRNMIKPQLFINMFEAGKNLLTISCPRCPHMGCALKWNREENSWDCPCHGSRFTRKGILLDNPSNKSIDKMKF